MAAQNELADALNRAVIASQRLSRAVTADPVVRDAVLILNAELESLRGRAERLKYFLPCDPRPAA